MTPPMEPQRSRQTHLTVPLARVSAGGPCSLPKGRAARQSEGRSREKASPKGCRRSARALSSRRYGPERPLSILVAAGGGRGSPTRPGHAGHPRITRDPLRLVLQTIKAYPISGGA